jgi:hypothetical protein
LKMVGWGRQAVLAIVSPSLVGPKVYSGAGFSDQPSLPT